VQQNPASAKRDVQISGIGLLGDWFYVLKRQFAQAVHKLFAID
jgi:hypothetical protein